MTVSPFEEGDKFRCCLKYLDPSEKVIGLDSFKHLDDNQQQYVRI